MPFPGKKIFKNYKLKNSNGYEREIDIFITYKIGYREHQIAVECKNHKNPIQVDAISTFTLAIDSIFPFPYLKKHLMEVKPPSGVTLSECIFGGYFETLNVHIKINTDLLCTLVHFCRFFGDMCGYLRIFIEKR